MFEQLSQHWDVLLCLVGLILAFGRLKWEGERLKEDFKQLKEDTSIERERIELHFEKEIARIETERKEDRKALWDKMDVLNTKMGDVKESLSRIEGYLKRDHGGV